jgi:hypothetical protein
MKFGYLRQDDASHWYLIPEELIALFETLMEKVYREDEEAIDEFVDKFTKYRLSPATPYDLKIEMKLYAEAIAKEKENDAYTIQETKILEHKEVVTCSVCGKKYAGKVPKGGDGSVLYPRRHKRFVPNPEGYGLNQHSYHREICDGSFKICWEDSKK